MRFETHSWALWQQAAGDPTNEASTSTDWTANAVLTLALAAVAILVAGFGAWLANERAKASEKTAREALEDARLARKEAVELTLWTGAIDAVNRFIGFDPAQEAPKSRMQDLRVAIMLLGDHFADWQDFDKWLAEEHALGSALALEAIETHNAAHGVDQHLERVGRFAAWAAAFSSNLRLLRKHGYKPKKIAHIREHAHDVRASLHQKYGWGPIHTEVPGIELVDDDLFPDEK